MFKWIHLLHSERYRFDLLGIVLASFQIVSGIVDIFSLIFIEYLPSLPNFETVETANFLKHYRLGGVNIFRQIQNFFNP